VADGPVYLVCDRCGFFYGDVRLYPEQTVECPECGSETAWAFPKLDKALEFQGQVREASQLLAEMSRQYDFPPLGGSRQHKSDCAVHNEPAFPARSCNCGATS